MMPPEHRSERSSFFSLKTPSRSQTSSSHAHLQPTSQSSHRPPFSVGQPYPPKLSPTITRVPGQDARSPSPNYFGLAVDSATDPNESAVLPRENWSPQTSSVKSFGAALPKQLPLDANPEFEAFRRQVDANRGQGFSLSTSQFGRSVPLSGTSSVSTPAAAPRPRPLRGNTPGSDASDPSSPPMPDLAPGARPVDSVPVLKTEADTSSLHDSAYMSAESKRNSSASLNPPFFLNIGRRESPAGIESPFGFPGERRSHIAKVADFHHRLSMTHSKADPPIPDANQAHRADTVPAKLESGGPSMMAPAQLKHLIESTPESEILLLDLRVSPQYAESRIRGALNLCIPTTLLKRATFNLQKLQTTFHAADEQDKFANWQKTSHLVVYDAFSSDKRDAISATNMIKKFVNEGYSGSMSILRGGFNTFAATCPQYVDRKAASSGANGLTLSSNGGPATIAPVIGGVVLPAASNNPNPFFSNIRQNQDLIDGVGQMSVAVPAGLAAEILPGWLRAAADTSDRGKAVSERFLRIELTEQSRMKDAYSLFNPRETGQRAAEDTRVQLSGIEKGVKNRYKDILPFEHARVRLEGRAEGSCDYVNASHLKPTRSHKRYIASQGPLPATFEDFWSVIWDQDVRVIVMLTAESEGGQLKCHPYWTAKEFGPIKLRSLSEKKVSLDINRHLRNSSSSLDPAAQLSHPSSSNGSHHTSTSQAEAGRRRANTTTSLKSNTATPPQTNVGHQAGNSAETPYVIIRKLALSHAAHPFAPIREITQLHYPSWPDFGAPAQPSHLLALVELANVMQCAALPAGASGPAASVGTGTDIKSGERRHSIRTTVDTSTGSWIETPDAADHVRPMLVHCSAGCGRTGAFCTVDSVIDMLKRHRAKAATSANQKHSEHKQAGAPLRKEASTVIRRQSQVKDADGDVAMVNAGLGDLSASIAEEKLGIADEGINTDWLDDDTLDLIAATVEDFRGQRLSMVQSLRQFVLCYETVIEWIWRHEQRGPTAFTGTEIRGRTRSGSMTEQSGV